MSERTTQTARPKLGTRANKLPLPPGTPVIIERPTPGEAAILSQYDWKPGDPVPSNFAALVAAAKQQAVEDSNTFMLPVPPDTPPIDMNTAVRSLESLPPEERRKWQAEFDAIKSPERTVIAEALQQAKQEQQAIEATKRLDSSLQNVSPDVAAQLKRLEAGEAELTPEREAELAAKAAEEDKANAKKGFTVEEFQEYVLCLEAGRSFHKTYPVLGGKLQVTLRELTPGELRRITVEYDQLRKASNSVQEAVVAFYFDARVCFQVASLSGLIHYVQVVPEAASSVEQYIRLVQENIFRTETVMRAVNRLATRFDNLLAALEQELSNPDFIEPRSAT